MIDKIRCSLASISYQQKKIIFILGGVLLVLIYLYFSSLLSNKKIIEDVREEIFGSMPSKAILVSYSEITGITGHIEAKYKLAQGDDLFEVVEAYCRYFLDQRGWYEPLKFGTACKDLVRNSEGFYKVNFCYAKNATIRVTLGRPLDASYDLIVTFFSRGGSAGGC